MLKKIPFVKLTSCGNNFVIVDETDSEILTEQEKSGFATLATSTSFGVGCDNLLIIQRCTEETLASIQQSRRYWNAPPSGGEADFLFRMFEPDGSEALCCGNGLICVANYLFEQQGIESASILTEIPLGTPKAISIGSVAVSNEGWANLGEPRRSPEELVMPGTAIPYGESICELAGVDIGFRSADLAPYTSASNLKLSGYLVFTGEPHFVVFPDTGFSSPELADYIFGESASGEPVSELKRRSFGTFLIEHIGNYINNNYRQLFPAGLNVNFARVKPSGIVENRCYERGVFKETLACGTGALAVSYVVQQVMKTGARDMTVYPLRCRWDDPEAAIRIKQTSTGWLLSTKPVLLFEGVYRMMASSSSGEDIPVTEGQLTS
ncbi:diaminopimelate epimerase [Marinobacterium jannaschii]|uniref:diaminopimelate epimerase n=1 Tax=Marinobacterium jannaschii TaxID=64970 RepID=UPI0006852AFC|nr:diaminopimelate epimerase [Marinobacterium jannaschii]